MQTAVSSLAKSISPFPPRGARVGLVVWGLEEVARPVPSGGKIGVYYGTDHLLSH